MSRAINMLLFAAMTLVLIASAGCGGGGDDQPGGPTTTLLPEQRVPEVQVQVVDHLFRSGAFSDDNLDADPIFSLIASATQSLDIAVTRINRQEVVNALLNEAQSGTQIRIVTEKAYYEAATYAPFYGQLEDAASNVGNIVIHTDNDNLPRLMHARFLIIDHARVVTGSYNWETVECENTYGDVISILNTAVAAAFTNQFNQMFLEGNFGVSKRIDTQQSFLVGGGQGMLEVYFGPNDQPRERLSTEINRSQVVVFSIQQFKDLVLANTLFGWLNASAENTMIGLWHDIAELGDQDENDIYLAFADYTVEPTGGTCYVSLLIDDTGLFNGYNVMNHKLMFCDNSLAGGAPSVIFTTANYTDLGFTLNDEVMLIMRDVPLANKYWRGLDFTNSLPPTNVQEAGDIQEFDQLLAMWPHAISDGANALRDFPDVPCGIVFGEVSNFRPTVTIDAGQGEFEDVDVDLSFEIEGTLFFSSASYGPIAPTVSTDTFVRSEIANPDHRYMLIVPAGEVTLRTVVVDEEGTANVLFQPDEVQFDIGPGGVKRINLKINQASTEGLTPGGGGGL